MSCVLYRLIAALARLAVRAGRSEELGVIALRQTEPPALNDHDRTLVGANAAALLRPPSLGWLIPPTHCFAGIGAITAAQGAPLGADFLVAATCLTLTTASSTTAPKTRGLRSVRNPAQINQPQAADQALYVSEGGLQPSTHTAADPAA